MEKEHKKRPHCCDLLNALQKRKVTSLRPFGVDWNPQISNLDGVDVQAVEAFIERFQIEIGKP
ncbi:MAG: hypothetical protein J0H74_00105 [Chitinophagaceae bacterium]|nr:hypothetical protein [Chitinophagaceae bacterium]